MECNFRRSKFKSEYYAIGKYRFDKLMAGSLRDVIWSATASEGLGIWVPKNATEVYEADGDNTFTPGQ